MAYVPFAPEIGAFYSIIAADGTTATFNNAADPNYCGILQDVTGLDSPDIRESGDVLVQADGGWHGNFYFGRRPITISGTVVSPTDAADRAAKLDLIRRVSNAMRVDAVLSWTNTAVGSVPMQTWVRRQQPLRITGPWTKTFQLLLVSQYAPLFSVANHSYGSNLVTNPNFETNTTGWGTAGSSRINTGATLTRVTAQHQTGVAALQVTTTATANEGADYTGLSVTAGQTYKVSAWVKGNAGGETVQIFAGDGTVGTGSTSIAATTAWQQVSLTYTPTGSGTTGVAIRNTSASVATFFVDNVQVTHGSVLQNDTVYGALEGENQGNWAAFPIFTVYGATTGTVSITNTTTGQVFQALSGLTLTGTQSVTIDTLNHTAVRNDGTNLAQYVDFVNSTWPALITGINHYSLSGAPSMDMAWRDTWV